MATAPTYITHAELKRIFPQLDEFDQKTPIYGWEATGVSNQYVAHDTGLVTALFVDGKELGSAESSSSNVTSDDKWFYDNAADALYYFNDGFTPIDKLMEAGEDFSTMVTQYRADASRYFDSRVDPTLPKEQLKDKSGNYDYIVIRTVGLIAACFMVKSKDHNSEVAQSFMEEAERNIELLNEGKAALSWQNTSDASQGIIRQNTTIQGELHPVDTRGEYTGTWDLLKLEIQSAGAIGTATFNVFGKDSDGLKNNKIVDNEKITGDYQYIAPGLQIRFAGAADDSQAHADDEWEIEVMGRQEYVDTSDLQSIKLTRTGTPMGRRYR